MLICAGVEPNPCSFDPIGFQRQLALGISPELCPVRLSHWFCQYLLAHLEHHAIEMSHVDSVICCLTISTDQESIDEVSRMWNHPLNDGPCRVHNRSKPHLKAYLDSSHLRFYFLHCSLCSTICLRIIGRRIFANGLVGSRARDRFLDLHEGRLAICFDDQLSVSQRIHSADDLIHNFLVTSSFALY